VPRGVQASQMKTPLQVGAFHEMGQWGFPQLGASRGSVYYLFERIGSEGLPGAKKFVVYRSALVVCMNLPQRPGDELEGLHRYDGFAGVSTNCQRSVCQ
jgi:hypothetical protein